jgi:hypothetical protein
MRPPRWAARALYVMALLAVLELALQAHYCSRVGQPLFARMALPIYTADPATGWRLRPGLAYRHRTPEYDVMLYTNRQGFRVAAGGGEYAAGKAPSTLRVLVLGPSFAFGWGVNQEEGFAAQLNGRLQEALPDRRVEVINAGVPAFSPQQHLVWLRRDGAAYRPDLVVQIVYGSFVLPHERIRVDDAGYLHRDDAGAGRRVQDALKQSAVVFYAWTAWARLRPARAQVKGTGRQRLVKERFDLQDPDVVEALAHYRALREATEGLGARLLLVFAPESYVVHREDVRRWAHLGVRDPAALLAYEQEFLRYLEGAGYDCVDLSAPLRDLAARGPRLYYWLDVHWTPAGNAAAARAVARHIVR